MNAEAAMLPQVAAGLRLAPLVPLWLLALLAALAMAGLTLAAARRARGTVWRGVALVLLLAWLAGPTLIEEHRIPLADIVLLVQDESASMLVGERPALARAAETALRRQVAALPGVELRVATMPQGEHDGSEMFAAIDRALGGLARYRLAAVVAITDGQIHDVPLDRPAGSPTTGLAALGVPLHVLLAGRGEETDRRLRLIEAPGYGVVGKSVTLRLAVDDLGSPVAPGAMARLTIRRDGEPPREQSVAVGVATAIELPITREGPSVVELTAEKRPGETSELNNRAVVAVTGVRDRLRVLLVSGEPHAGERMWRRLLKADPAVDLIHFTILRPPEKDDLTPLNELALIAFPTRELFQQKVREFDLIILDRFQNRGILPLPYLRNIADYVRQGGGLLVSVGPEFAGSGSLDQTPLRAVLPAHPDIKDGEDADAATAAVTGPFRPSVTAVGLRHPVTASLPGWRANEPAMWGNWYRRVPASGVSGQVVLSAPDGTSGGAPLLLLDRVGNGRVALLLSDQLWLWARGHDGGGPQAELTRRIAHWLMKQPDLEENALEARISSTEGAGGRLFVTRRSLADSPAPEVVVLDPEGNRHVLRLTGDAAAGTASGVLPATLPGVWQVSDGERTAYAAEMAGHPVELADLRATATRLAGATQRSGGSETWLGAAGTPSLRVIGQGRVAAGDGWIGVPTRSAHVTSSLASVKLLPDWLALTLLLGAVAFAWWRESV